MRRVFRIVMPTQTTTRVLAALMLTWLAAIAVPTAQSTQPAPRFLGESLNGKDSFESYCATCHGVAGRGDGPVGEALRRRPADLTRLAVRNGNRFPRERVTATLLGEGRTVSAHGTIEMPVWGPLFRVFEPDARVRVRIDNLVTYLETLQVNATAKESGAVLFQTYCASCHGSDARGAGPASRAQMPPSLTQFAARNNGVFPSERLRQIIDGRGVTSHLTHDMPVWGNAFKRTPGGYSDAAIKARIDAIVEYLARIQERPTE